MRIKMLKTACGPDVHHLAGQVYDVSEAVAKAYVEHQPPAAVILGPAPETPAKRVERLLAERKAREAPPPAAEDDPPPPAAEGEGKTPAASDPPPPPPKTTRRPNPRKT